jgi:hypothetical protein
MAWLEQHPTSRRFKVCFRWGGRQFKKTLKTTNPDTAEVVLRRVEETIGLAERGRLDRTFVYSSPAGVDSPAAFGRVRLVDRVDPDRLQPFGGVLLPVAVTKSEGFPCLYATACLSPTIEKTVARVEGKLLVAEGRVRKATPGTRRTLEGSGFAMWSGQWELFDLPPGTYTLEVAALGKDGRAVVTPRVPPVHGGPEPAK